MPKASSVQRAVEAFLDALFYEVETADDLQLLDIEAAESAIADFCDEEEPDGPLTDGLADALGRLARILKQDMGHAIGHALVLEEVRHMASYASYPGEKDLGRAEQARLEICDAVEKLLDMEGLDGSLPKA